MKITFENFQWHSLQLKSYFNTISSRFTQVWHDFTEWDVSVKVKMACDAPTHGRKYVHSRTFASTLLVSVFSREVEPAAEVWSRSDTSSRVQITWCWKVKSRLPISSKATGRMIPWWSWTAAQGRCSGLALTLLSWFSHILKVSRHFASCKYFCSWRIIIKAAAKYFSDHQDRKSLTIPEMLANTPSAINVLRPNQ